jgi:hypothetical protein
MQWKCFGRSLVVLALSSLLAACGGGRLGKAAADQKVTVPPGVSQFKGTFAFSATGSDSDGNYFVAGSFSANGRGGITGLEDFNWGSGVDSSVPFAGTYRVEAGSVTASLEDKIGISTVITFPIPDGSSAVAIYYDGTGTGTLQAQSAKGFSNTGTFAFKLNGEGNGEISGSGTFATSPAGTIISGTETYQDGTYSRETDELSGLLSPALERGRGTAVIGSNIFSYYVVSQNQIILAGLEDSRLIYGTATRQ